MLSNFKVILVETSHPGNIGAVARAMKNMRLPCLRLVKPKFFPHADATARSAGAEDVLRNAEIHDSLASAIADCHVVIGASARDRTISWPTLNVREMAERWAGRLQPEQQVALVFGRENNGLNNQELDSCHYLLRIPCNPDFSSLNLAAAVQVIGYELFVASGERASSTIGDVGEDPPASAEQMEAFYQHLQQTMADIGFLQPERSKSIMRRLRRLFNRSHLDTKELDILRGILRFSQNHNLK